MLPWGEISLVTVPLNYIYKSVLQIIERGFLTYFVYYMNMDITFFLGMQH